MHKKRPNWLKRGEMFQLLKSDLISCKRPKIRTKYILLRNLHQQKHEMMQNWQFKKIIRLLPQKVYII